MGLPLVVGRFKMRSAKRVNEMRGAPGVPVWQRGYFDHVIRGESEWRRIRKYIASNPFRWPEDEEHPGMSAPGK